jgi:hypothetical protein
MAWKSSFPFFLFLKNYQFHLQPFTLLLKEVIKLFGYDLNHKWTYLEVWQFEEIMIHSIWSLLALLTPSGFFSPLPLD